MIRLATRDDLVEIATLVEEEVGSSPYSHLFTPAEINATHLRTIIFNCLHLGYIWVDVRAEGIVGYLIAIREPNVWVPSRTSLREFAWYVRPAYRGGISGGRLFVKFCEQGDRLIAAGTIDAYFTTRMSNTADYDLESRGFRLTEKLYVKECA